MNYIYPAIFEKNSDGSYTITFPDLPGCISEGKDLDNAMAMAQDALTQWLTVALELRGQLPAATEVNALVTAAGCFATLIRAEVRDDRAVRRTVSLT